MLAGGSRGYDYRVDLRVVYQYYCGNHPRPTEPQYPLWMGLREGSTMTSAGLRARLQECTGFQSEPAARTELQQRNLDDILAVTGIPESTIESHLRFATFTFRDIVHARLGGRNPFSNRGSATPAVHDDKALNAGVERFAADPSARRDLSWDSDLTGAVDVPTLSPCTPSRTRPRSSSTSRPTARPARVPAPTTCSSRPSAGSRSTARSATPATRR